MSTGSTAHGRSLRLRDWIVGITAWIIWFGIGFYAWWFTSVPVIDFVIATIIWLVAFAFAVIGVPLIRIFGRERNRL